MIHIWRPWKLSNFQDPLPPLSIYIQNSSISLTLDVEFQTNPPPLQMITNQLKDNIIRGWILYVIRSFLQVGFRFQSQLINLVCLSLTSFHSAEKPHYLLFYDFILLCMQLSKNTTKCLLFIIIHIFITHFAINLF